jgi:signal transduction histidine kinase
VRSAKPIDNKLVQYATQATTRLESVVQNITQLAASINIKIERFQITDAIQTAMRHLERQWESSENVARIRIQAEDLPLVMGDRAAVGRVLQLLLDNALKFSSGGTPVELIAQQAENGVWIAVRDYGIGIADEQVGQVFQAFYQVDSSPTRRVGGAGVGLTLVKLVLDAMEIAIDVQSQLGVGSTFSFLLPIAEPDDLSTQLVAPPEEVIQSAKS